MTTAAFRRLAWLAFLVCWALLPFETPINDQFNWNNPKGDAHRQWLSDRTPSISALAPLQNSSRHLEATFHDDFRARELRPEWQWPHSESRTCTNALAWHCLQSEPND